MFTFVIPKISSIVEGSGQAVPFYTSFVFMMSDIATKTWWYVLPLLVLGIFGLLYWVKTPKGKEVMDQVKINIPVIGLLYRELYHSRIAYNLSILILSGIPLVRSIEITSDVVDHSLYKKTLKNSLEQVKGGVALSKTIEDSPLFANIFIQMIKVGEETGEVGNILETVAKFYEKEVIAAINTIVDLLVPVMIAFLGLAVGILLVMILMPIYNISSGGF